MNKDPLEFEETTKFNVIKEYMFYERLASATHDVRCYRELFLTYIQRKTHNNTKNRWVAINAKTGKFDSFYNNSDEQQRKWDEHVARTQVQKDVEDYLRETGTVLGLL